MSVPRPAWTSRRSAFHLKLLQAIFMKTRYRKVKGGERIGKAVKKWQAQERYREIKEEEGGGRDEECRNKKEDVHVVSSIPLYSQDASPLPPIKLVMGITIQGCAPNAGIGEVWKRRKIRVSIGRDMLLIFWRKVPSTLKRNQ